MLNCWSFLSSFSLNVFIKSFLKQKSKSSTNLNRKEWKQEETIIDYSTKILILGEKYLGCNLFSWGQFSRDHLSEGQLCKRQII